MTERDDLLRAAVFSAFDARGTADLPAAVERVVDAWMLWPLVEYAHAIEVGREWRAGLPMRLADAVALVRDSYADQSEAA